jgi:class 3 adenylate cyclase/pimeloyl-ACP methyl ester carboxylesterase
MKPTIKFTKRKDGVRLAYSMFGSGPGLVYVTPWVTDLETIVDHVNLDKFILFGMSCAGPVSIAYATQNPQKVTRMILYATWADGNDIAREEVRSAIIDIIKASWGIGSRTIADLFVPKAPPEILEQLTKFQRISANPEMAGKLLHLGYSMNVKDLISGITIPTLILHREGDRTAPIEEGRHLAKEIPNCCFKVFKGDIHLPWLGNSFELIDAILEFAGIEKPTDTASDSKPGKIQTYETAEQATIVFTDIVLSTAMVNKLGDAAARDIFIGHDKLVQKQLERHGGKELQNLGDGFMLSFESASSAIRCASAIQSELSELIPSLSIRIGINTGEVIKREGAHPFGQAVVVASRILSQCHGGQILVSDVTKKLVAGSKFSFLEREQFKPKGLDDIVSLYEVVWKN